MGFLIGFPLLILGPCLLAMFVGTRINSRLAAFLITWILTPLLTLQFMYVFTPVLRAIIPPGYDGPGVLMLPFLGIMPGLVAGVLAQWFVNRRNRQATATASSSAEMEHA